MKTWQKPVMEQLEISATANGQQPKEEFDGPWVSIDGNWYRPGSPSDSPAN